MANPTSAFGWQMPTSTDLVTDLPADFETFGQAVDTSLADLKGGTTGQVLSKASNTDMDFTWVAADDTNAIQNAIVDAKGDLIAASAADTPARLAVGNNGETLVADSSTSTGLRYQSAYNGNVLINGGQDIWQRGTSFTTLAAYTYCSDRWYYSTGSGGKTVSRQATGDTTNLPNIQYCVRLARNSGQTDTTGYTFHTALETSDSIPFAGQSVTFSFYARKGANFSGTTVATYINTGTGTDQAATGQNAGTWTGFASPLNGSTFTPTTTWTRYSFTVTIGSTATQIGLGFITSAFSGTAGAADYVEITGLQLERGSVATTFKRSNGAGGTIQGELAACQRYYWRSGDAVSYQTFGTGIGKSSTVTGVSVALPVSMRLVPQSLDYSNLAVFDGTTVVAVTSAVITAGQVDYNHGYLETTSASGVTQYRPYFLLRNGSTSGYVGFSAEL